MKTSKKDFERFKKEFLRWVDIFGLKGYRVVFYHQELEGVFAKIYTDEEGQLAEPCLNIKFRSSSKTGWISPEHHAKHEAIHLLLHRLYWLAFQRFAGQSEIEREWERLVRILEKVLK